MFDKPRHAKVIVPGAAQGHREPTQPVRVDTPPSAEELRSTRLLVGITSLSGLTLAFISAVAFQVLVQFIRVPPGADSVVKQCYEGDPLGCEVGYVCQGGQCVPAAKIEACQQGDPCGVGAGGCTCEAPMRCEDQVCRAEASSPMCESEAISRMLSVLAETCKGDWDSCPEGELQKFALHSSDFDEVLTAFGSAVTVHFPAGKPAIRPGDPWPSAAIEKHYIERLGNPQTREALQDAEVVVLIARSSRGGNERENSMYSRARNNLVTEMVLKASTRTPGERDAMRGKLKRLILNSHKILEPQFLLKHYESRMVAWSPEDEATLRANVRKHQELRGAGRTWTLNTLNQVVFVVPIPCKLPGGTGS